MAYHLDFWTDRLEHGRLARALHRDEIHGVIDSRKFTHDIGKFIEPAQRYLERIRDIDNMISVCFHIIQRS